MRLASFFAGVAPALLDQAPVEEVGRRLFAREPEREVDRRRLAIYARFCRRHRFEAIEGIYPVYRKYFLREHGRSAWERLVEEYFHAFPMRHVELSTNVAAFSEFLASRHAPLGDLADFEWWEWQTLVAPDTPRERVPSKGPQRINPTVELRPYPHDLVGWIAKGARGQPGATPTVVVFWRNEALRLRRENAEPIELHVLKCVSEGRRLATIPAHGITERALTATVSDLRKAGILLGATRRRITSRRASGSRPRGRG